MMKTVIRLGNDMVIVFDDAGEQMPEYQGQYQDMKAGILGEATSETVFNHWFGYSFEPVVVPAKRW